jgi:hypothetical protein
MREHADGWEALSVADPQYPHTVLRTGLLTSAK